MVEEVDAASVVEGARIAFEPVGEAAKERRRSRRADARGRAAVLGHEVVGALALDDVVPDRGGALDALAKDPRHE
jgi:hypothetical protein